MSTPRPTRSLPAVPSLEQQKKQARELLNAARAGDAEALHRVRSHHPRAATIDPLALSLADAQLVLAREYGLPSWPQLKAHIESVVESRRTQLFVREVAYHDERAHGLLAVLPDGAPSVVEQVRSWHPDLSDASDEDVRRAALTLDDARLIYARQHGFASWPRFVAHLDRLGAEPDREPFLAVFEAGKRGDWARATTILQAHPDLARARGTNGNTLLNLACSLAPCAPADADAGDAAEARAGEHRLAAVQLLLAAGADVQQANDRGWTPLHQAAYRNDPAMATLLLRAEARVDATAHGHGGTPLAVALFWGHREVAYVLAARAVVPGNLRIAAALGRADLAARCFDANGRLTPEARAGRAFYRPHSGFPAWRPSDHPQEILDEALVWAARSGRVEVMPLLVERGARVNADPYRGTPLLWAAANGRVAAVRWLLDHGAEASQRATFGGPSHGEGVTALHLAAQNDRVEVVELLLAHGADATIRDALYGSTPAGWAEHEGSRRAAAALAGAHRPQRPT